MVWALSRAGATAQVNFSTEMCFPANFGNETLRIRCESTPPKNRPRKRCFQVHIQSLVAKNPNTAILLKKELLPDENFKVLQPCPCPSHQGRSFIHQTATFYFLQYCKCFLLMNFLTNMAIFVRILTISKY